MTAPELVEACRYPDGPAFEESSGPWTIVRGPIPRIPPDWRPPGMEEDLGGLEPGEMLTRLHRVTSASQHLVFGECVMEDSRRELRRHLPILMAARGRVLVTGLGLGCVVRGLIAKPEVEHIDVVEIDPHVLRLVGWEFEDEPRVTIHEGDALTYPWPDDARWDFAWHDAWVEDGPLDELHLHLIARYADRVENHQGAWGWDRIVKQRLRRIYPGMLA